MRDRRLTHPFPRNGVSQTDVNRYRNLAGERRVVNLASSKPSRSQHPTSGKRTKQPLPRVQSVGKLG